MSSKTAIEITSLSKRYQIYGHPRDRLKQFIFPYIKKIFGRTSKNYFREFWALSDISFKVNLGETIGIIGRNGSGKSTLLQIICGTLNPSSGSIKANGRIAALLELGSGFNPEFTGRENVYLNASVLGLSQADIERRYSDIAKFADIGEFIEQPVKTYSSGMLVRLAFAVIAHVDADILVIDEALAVGDAAFTQKCMRFLRQFMKSGTLIFVSHDSAAIVNLCHSAIWLEAGQIKMYGEAKKVTESYLQATLQDVYGVEEELQQIEPPTQESLIDTAIDQLALDPQTEMQLFYSIENSTGWMTGAAQIESVFFTDISGKPLNTLKGGEVVSLTIMVNVKREMHSPIVGFFVKDRLGQALFGEHTFTYVDQPLTTKHGQKCKACFQFRMPLLPNGEYSMTASIAEGTPTEHIQHHWLHDAIIFKVSSTKLRYGLMGIPFQSVSLLCTEMSDNDA